MTGRAPRIVIAGRGDTTAIVAPDVRAMREAQSRLEPERSAAVVVVLVCCLFFAAGFGAAWLVWGASW